MRGRAGPTGHSTPPPCPPHIGLATPVVPTCSAVGPLGQGVGRLSCRKSPLLPHVAPSLLGPCPSQEPGCWASFAAAPEAAWLGGAAHVLGASLGLRHRGEANPHFPSASSDPLPHAMPSPHLTLRKPEPLHRGPPLLSSQTPIHSLPSSHLWLQVGKGPPPSDQHFLSGPVLPEDLGLNCLSLLAHQSRGRI